MDSNFEQAVFLCPRCEYGHFFRTVKSAEGMPYDMEYTCGTVKGPRGPGGWDGKSCPNFVEGKKKDPLDGCKITIASGEAILTVPYESH